MSAPRGIGARSTPAGAPAALRRRTVSSRFRGWGVPGSTYRQRTGSTVVIVRKTRTFATRAVCAQRVGQCTVGCQKTGGPG
jgi:hypothetical protein